MRGRTDPDADADTVLYRLSARRSAVYDYVRFATCFSLFLTASANTTSPSSSTQPSCRRPRLGGSRGRLIAPRAVKLKVCLRSVPCQTASHALLWPSCEAIAESISSSRPLCSRSCALRPDRHRRTGRRRCECARLSTSVSCFRCQVYRRPSRLSAEYDRRSGQLQRPDSNPQNRHAPSQPHSDRPM